MWVRVWLGGVLGRGEVVGGGGGGQDLARGAHGVRLVLVHLPLGPAPRGALEATHEKHLVEACGEDARAERGDGALVVLPLSEEGVHVGDVGAQEGAVREEARGEGAVREGGERGVGRPHQVDVKPPRLLDFEHEQHHLLVALELVGLGRAIQDEPAHRTRAMFRELLPTVYHRDFKSQVRAARGGAAPL